MHPWSPNRGHNINNSITVTVNDGGMFAAMNSVPRVLFDRWTAEDYTALFSSENEQDICSRTLILFLQVCHTQPSHAFLESKLVNTRLMASFPGQPVPER